MLRLVIRREAEFGKWWAAVPWVSRSGLFGVEVVFEDASYSNRMPPARRGAGRSGGGAHPAKHGASSRLVLPRPLNPTFFVKPPLPAFLNCFLFQTLYILLFLDDSVLNCVHFRQLNFLVAFLLYYYIEF